MSGTIRCGTVQGYRRHWRRAEDACQPCKDAVTNDTRDRTRDHNNAERELKALHPDEFAELFQEEKDKQPEWTTPDAKRRGSSRARGRAMRRLQHRYLKEFDGLLADAKETTP